MRRFSPGGFDMSTHIHVRGLSYFCTDDKLRQAFTPFGTVVLARVLRDECGHSLGLGIVHMASSEEVERVFDVRHLFEVSGSRVDLWEAEDPEDSPSDRIASGDFRERPVPQGGHDTAHEKRRKAFQRLAVLRQRLFQTLMLPSR
jgi:hypothetical protein